MSGKTSKTKGHQLVFEFPFSPVSVNQCYGTNFKGGHRFKSKKYEQFIDAVAPYLPFKGLTGEVEVEYNFYFKDKRKRDICNYEKSLTDTLVHYGVIEDDSLITKMTIEKGKEKRNLTVIEIKK